FFSVIATATTQIYTLSLHDALPIYRFVRKLAAMSQRRDLSFQLPCNVNWHHLRHRRRGSGVSSLSSLYFVEALVADSQTVFLLRSEEHTSELQSRFDLVCRLLLEKK